MSPTAHLLFCTLLFSASNAEAAMQHELEEINTLSYNCYQLECLWHALYGATNPLLSYIETYKTAIKEYTARCNRTCYRNTTQDYAAELVTVQLQDQLKQVKERAQELLDQYELTPLKGSQELSPLTVVPPSAYAAVPLRNFPPTTQDTTLQQVLTALQNLQAQQQSTHTQEHPGTLKEQLILFGLGILFLGAATYFIKTRLSKNIVILKAETHSMLAEIEAPHSQNAPCGMRAQLDCAINQFNNKGGSV